MTQVPALGRRRGVDAVRARRVARVVRAAVDLHAAGAVRAGVAVEAGTAHARRVAAARGLYGVAHYVGVAAGYTVQNEDGRLRGRLRGRAAPFAVRARRAEKPVAAPAQEPLVLGALLLRRLAQES